MKSTVVQEGSVERVAALLRGSPLFRSLSDEHLRLAVTRATLIQLEPGETIVREGESPEGLLLVLDGELRVVMGGAPGKEAIEIARFGPGQTVGAASLVLDRPSEATVNAVARTTVACVPRSVVVAIVEQAPSFGLELARVLAERLASAVDRIPAPEAEPGLRPSDEALALLPHEFMTRHRLLPLSVDGDVATIGFADPPTPEVVQRIRTHLPTMELRAVRVPGSLLDEALRTRIGAGPGVGAGPTADRAALERLLQAMSTEGASDLHLAGGQRPRWRIDGEIHEIADVPVLGPETALELLGGALPDRNREEFARTNDTDFALELAGVARFRVNLFRDLGGVGAVLRMIPTTILSLERLGMPKVVAQLCALPKGLVLVTGPTGSGKSTTLAAMVDLINRTRREHVVSLEDPVEFVHASKASLVNQREVGPHTSSFARAIRAALREDPDIILVGEMRDLETVSLALEAANTGHLVLATLHTSTAVSTVERIIGLFPPEEQSRIQVTLADVMRGVVSQVLLRRVGGGRVAALEILIVNAAVSNLIREGKVHQIASSMQTGKAIGNQMLNESLAELARSGTVAVEEALAKAVDKADLARRLGRSAG